jgi:hypothetical protein
MQSPDIYSFRFALDIINQTPELEALYSEILQVIAEISDDDLILEFERLKLAPAKRGKKNADFDDDLSGTSTSKMSLSASINNLIDLGMVKRGWTRQSSIFQGEEYRQVWTLDFSKQTEISIDTGNGEDIDIRRSGMAVEVAFNHGEAIAWNLMKPVLAAEINHVEKQTDIGAGIGVMITATKALKSAGAFDGSVGEFEKVIRYLKPMRNQLTVPMIIIGLKPPVSFKVKKKKDPLTRKNEGFVILIEN